MSKIYEFLDDIPGILCNTSPNRIFIQCDAMQCEVFSIPFKRNFLFDFMKKFSINNVYIQHHHNFILLLRLFFLFPRDASNIFRNNDQSFVEKLKKGEKKQQGRKKSFRLIVLSLAFFEKHTKRVYRQRDEIESDGMQRRKLHAADAFVHIEILLQNFFYLKLSNQLEFFQ